MFGHGNFHGSTTVGERGQIVLPASLREEMDIKSGEKLLVLTVGPPNNRGIMVLRAKALEETVKMMNEHMQSILDKAKEE